MMLYTVGVGSLAPLGEDNKQLASILNTHALTPLSLILTHAQSKTMVVPSLHRVLREKGEADVSVRLTLVDVDNSHHVPLTAE